MKKSYLFSMCALSLIGEISNGIGSEFKKEPELRKLNHRQNIMAIRNQFDGIENKYTTTVCTTFLPKIYETTDEDEEIKTIKKKKKTSKKKKTEEKELLSGSSKTIPYKKPKRTINPDKSSVKSNTPPYLEKSL